MAEDDDQKLQDIFNGSKSEYKLSNGVTLTVQIQKYDTGHLEVEDDKYMMSENGLSLVFGKQVTLQLQPEYVAILNTSSPDPNITIPIEVKRLSDLRADLELELKLKSDVADIDIDIGQVIDALQSSEDVPVRMLVETYEALKSANEGLQALGEQDVSKPTTTVMPAGREA